MPQAVLFDTDTKISKTYGGEIFWRDFFSDKEISNRLDKGTFLYMGKD